MRSHLAAAGARNNAIDATNSTREDEAGDARGPRRLRCSDVPARRVLFDFAHATESHNVNELHDQEVAGGPDRPSSGRSSATPLPRRAGRVRARGAAGSTDGTGLVRAGSSASGPFARRSRRRPGYAMRYRMIKARSGARLHEPAWRSRSRRRAARSSPGQRDSGRSSRAPAGPSALHVEAHPQPRARRGRRERGEAGGNGVTREERRSRRVEVLATILLAVAAVATAWSSYQASRWNGEQTKQSGTANRLRIEAARAQGLSEAQKQADLATFTEWVDAYFLDRTELADFSSAASARSSSPLWLRGSPRGH